jgi:anaerobic magnesium-protoporphyrin IX monomethyl ester cyclase
MKPVRILLVDLGLNRRTAPIVTFPLGIMYLASYLRTKFKAQILLVNQKLDNCPSEALVARARDFNPDVVGLSAITNTAQQLPAVTQCLRRALPHALIVLGGPHVSAVREDALTGTAADAAVPGEGEIALERIIQSYLDGAGLEAIPGIVWRSRDGDVISNPGAVPTIDDLDTLPRPAYDLLNLDAYWRRQSMAPIPRKRYISLFSSRGCPFHCIYCHNVFGKRYRSHSAERIVEEMRFFKDVYGVDEIEFLDDIFNYDRARLADFCRRCVDERLDCALAFPNGMRGDLLKTEDMDALVEAGMYYSAFGLESGSPRIQQIIGKRLNLESCLENIRHLVGRRVFTYGFMMLGFPTETEADIEMSINVAASSHLHLVKYTVATPFPNSELYRMAMRRCPEKLRGLQYMPECSHMSINLSEVSDDRLLYLQRKANRAFYCSPRRILRILRDFPRRRVLPTYIPEFLRRLGVSATAP